MLFCRRSLLATALFKSRVYFHTENNATGWMSSPTRCARYRLRHSVDSIRVGVRQEGDLAIKEAEAEVAVSQTAVRRSTCDKIMS